MLVMQQRLVLWDYMLKMFVTSRVQCNNESRGVSKLNGICSLLSMSASQSPRYGRKNASRPDFGWAGLGELMNQLDGVLDNEDIITNATTNHVA